MQRTIKLKLNTTQAQEEVLKHTLSEFTQAFNFVCEYGWLNSEKNGVKLHHATYYTVKEHCKGLVSDLIVQARLKATEALKSAFARNKAGRKATRPRSNLCPARYNLHTYKLNWQTTSVNLATSPGNRLVIGFTTPKYATKYVGLPFDTADLIYRKGSFWLHVVVSVPEFDFLNSGETIGIDLGLTHPAVTSKRKFLGSRHWKEVDRRYFRSQRVLQSKGTKSAKRHLRKLAGKRMRFRRDCDHVLSKRIVQSAASGATIVIENLTEIRSRARLRKGEGQRRLHSWSFAQLRSFLTYKAEEAGMKVVAIDPRHSSQTCSRCGYQSRSNRTKQSRFLCKECFYQLNADLNASYNIRDKHLASLGISLAGGPQSMGLSHPPSGEVQAVCFS
ncbi:MAG: transposase [Chloroflexi bacterium]|nr:transposase [Chloroflexota bacterium]